jgi:hypothetical protein
MANIFVTRSPLWIRWRTLRELKRGRGSQLEIQSPLPIRVITFQDGAGAASGDSTVAGTLDAFGDFAGAASGDSIASGAFDALGDFAGAASGDATASGALDALADFAGAAIGDAIASAEGDYLVAEEVLTVPFYRSIERGTKRTLGRGPQVEFQAPITLTATNAVTIDGDGSAIGDATASGALDAFGDFAGAASGDAIASGALDAFADFAGSAIGDSTASGALDALADFAGAASGDSTASGGLDALADFAGAASGDATVSGTLEALADFAGAAQGDSTASGALDALGDFAGSAIGDAIASAEAEAGDTAGSAIGDSTASGGFEAFADFAGSAIGDSTATAEGASDVADTVVPFSRAIEKGFKQSLGRGPQFVSEVPLPVRAPAAEFGDGAGSAIGDSTCEGFIEDATPVVVTPPVDAGGVGRMVFPGVWNGKPVKKRKKRLDDLDEMIAELRSRIEEVQPDEDDFYQRRLRVSAALAQQPDLSLRDIENQIALLQEAINEIDDEEAILLLAA